MEDLFESLNKSAWTEFEQVNINKFDSIRVFDWREHVPLPLQDAWDDLTERERKIIFIMAETIGR